MNSIITKVVGAETIKAQWSAPMSANENTHLHKYPESPVALVISGENNHITFKFQRRGGIEQIKCDLLLIYVIRG